MDEPPIVQPGLREPAEPSSSGCLQAGLLIFMVVWIFTTSLVSQTITWALEQQVFTSAAGSPDFRWLVSLVYGVAIIIPAAIIWAAGRALPQRHFYQAFFLAGAFVIFLVPARLVGITRAQITALLQIAGSLAFLLVIRRRAAGAPGWQGLWVALLVAGVLSYPWALWGALGSAWDTILNFAAALAFGAAAARIAAVSFQREGDPARSEGLFLEGLVMALALLAMATGLGANGNQGLLALAVPGLGWGLAAIYHQAQLAGGRITRNDRVVALLAGLAAFWPMAFIDPDELQTEIALGPGELIQWANLAAVVGLGICLAASLLLVFLSRNLQRWRAPLAALLAGLAWVGALALYLGPGQPGLYGERLFVILKDQADLSPLAQSGDVNQRRSQVYTALVAKADSTQASIRRTLGFWRIAYKPYYLENALEVQGGPLVRLWLQSLPEVDRVLDDPILRPLPEPVPESKGSSGPPQGAGWNLRLVNADRVWNELGVTGKGIIVGQSDSGVDGAHPELASSYRGQGGNNTYNWFDPWYHTAAPTDIGGHGTHTLATAVGNKVGVAPGAQWIGCVNLARNLGNPAFYLDCMQFMLAPFPQNGDPLHDGRPELGANVLNNSWGCPPVEGCDPNALLPAVKALRAAGIFVVASAGNDGDSGCGTVRDPIALYAQVFSVGAVNSGGRLVSFSSTGPVEVDGSRRTKPDIVAPGANVLSAFPQDSYAVLSGTSMAGPHVVGVVALMWSANPALIGDIDRTQQILDETATPYQGNLPSCVAPGTPNDGVGYGIVNAYDAVRKAMGK